MAIDIVRKAGKRSITFFKFQLQFNVPREENFGYSLATDETLKDRIESL